MSEGEASTFYVDGKPYPLLRFLQIVRHYKDIKAAWLHACSKGDLESAKKIEECEQRKQRFGLTTKLVLEHLQKVPLLERAGVARHMIDTIEKDKNKYDDDELWDNGFEYFMMPYEIRGFVGILEGCGDLSKAGCADIAEASAKGYVDRVTAEALSKKCAEGFDKKK